MENCMGKNRVDEHSVRLWRGIDFSIEFKDRSDSAQNIKTLTQKAIYWDEETKWYELCTL